MKVLKVIIGVVYVLLLGLVFGKLFFEERFDALVESILTSSKQVNQTLTIGFPDTVLNLNPVSFDSVSRQRLAHIYESLIYVNPDFELKPGLAISFGAIDDVTWEFRLRPNVYFHDGSLVSIDDVIFSLKEGKENAASGLKNLAGTIKNIEKINNEIFRVTTYSPDPLLIAKLANFYIFPQRPLDDLDRNPIGTGPFAFEKNENGNIFLKRFENYWGKKNVDFKNVVLKSIVTKTEKQQALKNFEVDILANLPADMGRDFDFDEFVLKDVPGLEVVFLMFNFDKTFIARELREAVLKTLDTKDLARFAQGFAAVASQFVGRGVFGFDPSIKIQKESLGSITPTKVSLDLPAGLEAFGKNIKKQLEKIGIEVGVNLLQPSSLNKKIVQKQSEFFFFGWKSELGDALDFLSSVAYSKGEFNFGNYSNPEVDNLIELSQKTLDQKKRLEYMREAMRIITVKDIIGIPLFSPEALYAVSDKIKWTPRVDGLVLAQEVKMW